MIELGKGVTAEMNKGLITISAAEGNVKLEVKAGMLVVEVLADLEKKIESGEIDPVKGTDMDKIAALQFVAWAKKELALA